MDVKASVEWEWWLSRCYTIYVMVLKNSDCLLIIIEYDCLTDGEASLRFTVIGRYLVSFSYSGYLLFVFVI